MYPALPATALTPTARQASATSIASSMKITGSLYVNATLRQPSRTAVWASASGEASELSVSISRDLEMSQFWQNRQARLQPAVPKDSTGVPGRKWLSGFFSTGSTQKPDERPYEARTTWSSTRPRTKHRPRCPSWSLHARGQTSHWIRPSGSVCQYRVGTVYGSSNRRSAITAKLLLIPAGNLCRMDWNLRSCGRHGHVTYAPAEAELRTRLHAQTPLGEAWRCLRCGDYVLGPARASGPAGDAPQVMRGKALRDAVILRLLAGARPAPGPPVLAAADGVWRVPGPPRA